jgi:hypothetical protein
MLCGTLRVRVSGLAIPALSHNELTGRGRGERAAPGGTMQADEPPHR